MTNRSGSNDDSGNPDGGHRKTLTLKGAPGAQSGPARVSRGAVMPSRGARSTVVVETRKRKITTQDARPQQRRGGLTDHEAEAREKALREARQRDVTEQAAREAREHEARIKREAIELLRREEEARQLAERQAMEAAKLVEVVQETPAAPVVQEPETLSVRDNQASADGASPDYGRATGRPPYQRTERSGPRDGDGAGRPPYQRTERSGPRDGDGAGRPPYQRTERSGPRDGDGAGRPTYQRTERSGPRDGDGAGRPQQQWSERSGGAGRPERSGTRDGGGAGRPQQQRPFSPAPHYSALADASPEMTDRVAKSSIIRKPRPKTEQETEQAKAVRKGDEQRRRAGRLNVHANFDDEGNAERGRSLAAMRRRRAKQKRAGNEPPAKIARAVVIHDTITVQELAARMSERAVDVIALLMRQGVIATASHVLDQDTAQLIAEELGHSAKRTSESDIEEGLAGISDALEDMQPRAPVVTIMGHVDHGKTSLLDAFRKSRVTASEAGGITQHIGAYQISRDGKPITFIDTPGHAAFTAMRARGAGITDIVVVVVAADDGVMPQTVEAISHARAAGAPIIIAINKIDLPAADPSRARTELLQHEIVVESMGGDTLEAEVSAKTGQNLESLLDAILLQAEVLELSANPDCRAEGVVIEARVDRGKGVVATTLVRRGTLRVGDIVVAGGAWGRVRALSDEYGRNVSEASPSMPVGIIGFGTTPAAGDTMVVVESESRARDITEYRLRKERESSSTNASRATLEMLMAQRQGSEMQKFPLVVKGDVQGSVEAITGALEKLGNDEVRASIVHSAAGGISESDVALASASGAVILAFNVRATPQARAAAAQAGVEIRYYSIIYDLVDDVKAAMSGMLSPEIRETFIGNAAILEVFNISKVGRVAGCRVTEGMVERGAGVRLIRDNVVVHEGRLSTLKRFKDEVKAVHAGQECGMAFEHYQDMRQGDIIECFRVEKLERTL